MNRFGDAVPGFGDAQFKLSIRPTRRTRLAVFGLLGRETARELGTTPDVGVAGGGSTTGSVDGTGQPQTTGRITEETTGTQYTGMNRLGVMNLWWTPGASAGHDDDGLGVWARRARLRRIAADRRRGAVPADGARKRFRRPAPRRVRRVREVNCWTRASKRTASRSSWQMANVKQLDAFRGLGPSTGGELVDYSAGPIRTQSRRARRRACGCSTGCRSDRSWASSRACGSNGTRSRARRRGSRACACRPASADTIVWTGVAVQAQTPSHESLQGFDYFHLTGADGATLRNERSRQFVAGVEQTFGAGFCAAASRPIGAASIACSCSASRPRPSAPRGSPAIVIPPDVPPDSVVLELRPTVHAESTGRGSAAGVEVLLQRNTGRLNGSLAYTFSKATREMYGHTFPFDFDRPHALAAHGRRPGDAPRARRGHVAARLRLSRHAGPRRSPVLHAHDLRATAQ